MKRNTKLFVITVCASVFLMSASPALAAGGLGGAVIAIGGFNNGGATAGNGGNGSSGGNGGNVEAAGAFNNGGASAGSGGNGGSVESSQSTIRLSTSEYLTMRLTSRLGSLSR